MSFTMNTLDSLCKHVHSIKNTERPPSFHPCHLFYSKVNTEKRINSHSNGNYVFLKRVFKKIKISGTEIISKLKSLKMNP